MSPLPVPAGGDSPADTLAAMGLPPRAIDTAIHLSFCADDTPKDVDAFLELEDGVKNLKNCVKS